jgi:integrase
MSVGLRQAIADYLAVRRSLGFRLARPEKLLAQLAGYLEQAGAATVTTEHALAWAVLPGGDPAWHAYRLAVARGFAAWLRTVDPAAEIPPAGLIPARKRRATPYLYADDEVAALITAAESLRSPLRTATYQTLIGLLSVSGMRVGEVIGLDRGDADLDEGVLTVRQAKHGKSRLIPLHTRPRRGRCAPTSRPATSSAHGSGRPRCSSPRPEPGCSTATCRPPGSCWPPPRACGRGRRSAARAFTTSDIMRTAGLCALP